MHNDDTGTIKLFSMWQVVVATVVGGPVSGAFLIHRNCTVRGDTRGARMSLVAGFGGTAILFVLAFVLPDTVPGALWPVVSTVVVHYWYKTVHEATYRQHIARGGERGSWLVVLGVSLLFFSLTLLVLAGVWYVEFTALRVVPE